jgi:hypothetical protein
VACGGPWYPVTWFRQALAVCLYYKGCREKEEKNYVGNKYIGCFGGCAVLEKNPYLLLMSPDGFFVLIVRFFFSPCYELSKNATTKQIFFNKKYNKIK